MHRTGPLSRHYDEQGVVAPERRGAVAWSQFNEHYERLQLAPWQQINEGTDHPFWLRWLRLLMAWSIQRQDTLLDLERKAALFADLPLPRDPDVVFFGAEVGWEALLVQALFGDGGRVVLVDCDPAAYQRYLNAPVERIVRAPRGWPERDLVLRRDPERIEYVQGDFFDRALTDAFDVGIDWGLLEHFPGEARDDVLRCFADWLREGGLEISAVPRDAFPVRTFYRVFADELNFGYRELLTPPELAGVIAGAGFEVVAQRATPTTCVAVSRLHR